MNQSRSKLKKITFKALCGLMVFWLSGLMVFACCGADFLVASLEEEVVSCPMSGGGHDCCKKDDGKSKISESEGNPDCCVFKPVKTLSADLKNSKESKQLQTIVKIAETPKPIYFVKQSYKSTPVYRSAIRNRGSTYIKNCVFRI